MRKEQADLHESIFLDAGRQSYAELVVRARDDPVPPLMHAEMGALPARIFARWPAYASDAGDRQFSLVIQAAGVRNADHVRHSNYRIQANGTPVTCSTATWRKLKLLPGLKACLEQELRWFQVEIGS